jgi:hypothetical protein
MRQLIKLPLARDKVVTQPSAGEDLAHRHSRSLILLALFAGALVAILALQAGAPLLSRGVASVLDGERVQVAGLTRELAAARREIERRDALTSQISEIRQAGAATALYLQQVLEEERKRVSALTQELAAVRRDLEARTAKAAAAAEAVATPLQEALERERQRADVLAGKLAAARQEIEATTAAASPPDTRAPQVEPQATPARPASDPSAIESPVPAEPEVGVEAKKLLARAELFLRQGDIGAARVVLERAVAVGSAEAGYRLAETYDPRVLSSWGTLGTRGDPAKARELYARAYADGIQQAKDRMNALQ